ncbi:unnamed protein product [Calypogeia fissa]
MRQHCIGVIAEQGAESVLAKILEQSKKDDIVPTLSVLHGSASWRDRAAKKMGIQIDRFQSTGSDKLELAPIKGFVWLLEELGMESYQLAKQVLQTYLHFGELDDHALDQLLGMHKTIVTTSEALEEWQFHTVVLKGAKNTTKMIPSTQTLE